jgi:hypothetical protein
MTLEIAKVYLARMERDRNKNEHCNKRTYADARNLAAWVSVVEFGNEEYSKRALKAIKNIGR